MNHGNHYFKLVYGRQKLERKKGKDVYYEKHHILPVCFGGGNEKENLVLLTAKEHFIAHLLLTEMYTGKDKAKMSFALFQMCRRNSQHQRLISSRQFEKAKQIMSESCRGENGSFFGKTHTLEHRKKLSERMKLNNPAKGKPAFNKGKLKPLSEERKKLQSEKMKIYCLDPAVRKQRGEAWKFRKTNTPTEETRRKISETLKRHNLEKRQQL